jgi:hypothetical protein
MELKNDVVSIILGTKQDYYNYLMNKEIKNTELEKTRARLAVVAEAIKADREVQEFFVKEFFKEREILMSMANKSLDKAIELGDIETSEIILQFINTIYEKNLFELKKKMFR